MFIKTYMYLKVISWLIYRYLYRKSRKTSKKLNPSEN